MNSHGWFPLGLSWFDDLAVQGTLKSLLQYYYSEASIIWHSAFFMVQLLTSLHDYWKNHGFDSTLKVMSLLFNTLSSFCHSFSSEELVSFNFLATVIIHSDSGAQENQICHCFHFLRIYLPWSGGTRCYELHFFNVEFYASFFTLLFHPHQEFFS